MKGVAKVAVSIPVETLRLLERVRKKARSTRSAAVTEAIQQWLAAKEMGEADERYVEGYLRQPERADEQTTLASAVVEGWEKWE
jgi:metal-responsive CopG/Arc/MetJ family transcriptional regulator